MDVLTATRAVPIRELARRAREFVDEIEKDGKAFVVSRRGRMVAVLIPIPERLIIEFEEGRPFPASEDPDDEGIDLDELDLSELAKEFLIDAASTPTGNWSPPESALLADDKTYRRALRDIDYQGLVEHGSASNRRINRKGRAVVRMLKARGQKGYAEVHGDHYLEP